MRFRSSVLAIAIGMCLLPAAGAQTDMQHLLSRLQSMGHGYYPAAEWNAIIDDIHGLVREADAAGDTGKMVDITVILAEVYSGMLHQHARALDTVNDLKGHLEGLPAGAAAGHGMAKLYVKLAEIHSRIGDPSAIQRLVDEFKAGPFYDPEDYAITGLTAPDDPIRIRRPHGQGEDSITVSSMNRYLRVAGLAPGNPFPAFSGLSIDRRPVQIPEPAARVVLVDFWVPDWVAWQRDLPTLISAYSRYHGQGFEIVGFNLAASAPDAVAAICTANGMNWPQVVGDRSLASRCAVAGEATNFLVDGNGRILARNIRGSDLTAALRSVFGE